jgi:hypothetical protein
VSDTLSAAQRYDFPCYPASRCDHARHAGFEQAELPGQDAVSSFGLQVPEAILYPRWYFVARTARCAGNSMILTNIQNICTPRRDASRPRVPAAREAQDESVHIQSARAEEQIIVSQIMTNKRPVYVQALRLTDAESRVFWPVYDEYEAKVRGVDDRLICKRMDPQQA